MSCLSDYFTVSGTDATRISQAKVSLPLLPPSSLSVYFKSSRSAAGLGHRHRDGSTQTPIWTWPVSPCQRATLDVDLTDAAKWPEILLFVVCQAPLSRLLVDDK